MNVCRENRELSWLKFNDRVLMQAKDFQPDHLIDDPASNSR